MARPALNHTVFAGRAIPGAWTSVSVALPPTWIEGTYARLPPRRYPRRWARAHPSKQREAAKPEKAAIQLKGLLPQSCPAVNTPPYIAKKASANKKVLRHTSTPRCHFPSLGSRQALIGVLGIALMMPAFEARPDERTGAARMRAPTLERSPPGSC